MDEFLSILQVYGLPGILVGLVVLVAIYLFRLNGMVITGNQARFANIALAAILSGLASDPGALEAQITALVASLVSGLLHEGITQYKNRRAG